MKEPYKDVQGSPSPYEEPYTSFLAYFKLEGFLVSH
jgi:hypothetical protein